MTIINALAELQKVLQQAIDHINRLEERVERQLQRIDKLERENDALRMDIHFLDSANKRTL